jgi:Holliday junction resolvasome RuvABC ATP-dependent DNA helicase subunit
VVEKPVEEVGLEEFKALGENDILFIDSTHTVKMGEMLCIFISKYSQG